MATERFHHARKLIIIRKLPYFNPETTLNINSRVILMKFVYFLLYKILGFESFLTMPKRQPNKKWWQWYRWLYVGVDLRIGWQNHHIVNFCYVKKCHQYPNSVTNISNLSAKQTVSTIHNQHRCDLQIFWWRRQSGNSTCEISKFWSTTLKSQPWNKYMNYKWMIGEVKLWKWPFKDFSE